jgi:hypothetical protein
MKATGTSPRIQTVPGVNFKRHHHSKNPSAAMNDPQDEEKQLSNKRSLQQK